VPYRAEVPPEVTAGWVVVVVGGIVVVVVGALVGEATPGAPVVGVVVGAVVGGAPGAGVPPGTAGPGGWDPDRTAPPGCSRATVTPMKAATPVVTSTAARVRRPMRTCVRVRASGEKGERLRVTTS
jgi:hypothetical protein